VSWRVAPVAVLVVLAACGTGGDGDRDDGGSATVRAELEVTAGVVGDPASRGTARLTCGPDGWTGAGWHTAEEGRLACERLRDAAARDALRPPPPDEVCAEIYGGPDVATVTGTLDGTAVDARLDRSNACASGRWDALVPLVPEPTGAVPGGGAGDGSDDPVGGEGGRN
jgi:hypothetical protein